MAVLIGEIAPRSTVTSDGNLEIEGARDVLALNVGDRNFVFVAGLRGDGITSFELGSNGALTNSRNIADNGTLELDGAVSFASARIGSSTYLYVNGFQDDGISAFRVNSDGSLTNIQNIDDALAHLEINGTRGRMATTTVGGDTYLVATGYLDNGFTVFRVASNGELIATDNVNDRENGAFQLADARDSAAAVVDGNSFVFVAGYADSGISSFQLGSNGQAVFRDSVSDASNAALQLQGTYGLATAEVNGTTYLIGSGEEDDGLSVFSVSGSGELTNVFNVADDGARGLDSPRSVTTFELEGEIFVSVSSATDNALAVFHLGSGGVLTDVTTLFDSPDVALDGSRYNAFASVDGVPLLLGTGQADSGVSTFEMGGGNDKLKGGGSNDLLLGLDGNDNLKGGGGKDRLKGGDGNDKLQGGNARDILMGDKGKDDFIFTKTKESGTSGGKRDQIEGFKGQDDIVLKKIDADKTDKGNQAFELDDGGAFEAGEIRVKETKKGVLLEMNVDNDAKAEMSILLADFNGKINDSDFVF